MTTKKLIACFDVIGDRVTKARKFQDNIDVADAGEMARRICAQQIDELIFFDVTASNEKRRSRFETLKTVAKNASVPIIAGGGIRTIDDMREAFEAGAAKVSVDSGAVRNPDIIKEGAKAFGSRRIVLSMQVQKVEKTAKIPSGYEVAIDGARVFTGMDGVEWAKRGEQLGAGEICVNSIDNDGMHIGFDLEITGAAANAVKIPIIASGGAGKPEHLYDVFTKTRTDAAIISSMLYSPRLEKNFTVKELKEYLIAKGVAMTPYK